MSVQTIEATASMFAAEAGELEIGAEHLSRGRTVTEADLVAFASQTGDWHPQHTDSEWAARSRFGGRIAHGMLVLSWAVGLVPFDPDRVVALRGLDSVTFKRPVPVGDTIRVRTRVEGVRRLDEGHSLVQLGWRVLNQRDQVVLRARVEVLWRGSGDEPLPDPDDLYEGQVLL